MLDNIKSSYILKELFKYVNEYKKLKLLNYNKTIQQRINLSIEDYKNYLSIKIEVKLIDNYNVNCNNTFISKEFKNSYSSFIYVVLNDETIERKIDSIKNDKISKVKIILNYDLNSYKDLFKHCYFIKEIKFLKNNKNNVTDMSNMFYGCSSLTSLDISELKTDNVKI